MYNKMFYTVYVKKICVKIQKTGAGKLYLKS